MPAISIAPPAQAHYNAEPRAQEAIEVELRRSTLLPLDDLGAVVREFINPDVSRSGLDRCLRCHGVANLRQLQAQALADAGEGPPAVKTFKDYEPGFVHMTIKYLPQMPDESCRRYLFVAIDRATRCVFMRIYGDQSEVSSVDFLSRLERAAPMKIINCSQTTVASSPTVSLARRANPRDCTSLTYAAKRSISSTTYAHPPPPNQWHGGAFQWPHQRPTWSRRWGTM